MASELRGKMYHSAREEIHLKKNQPVIVNTTTTNSNPPQVEAYPAPFEPSAPNPPPPSAYPPMDYPPPPPPYSEQA